MELKKFFLHWHRRTKCAIEKAVAGRVQTRFKDTMVLGHDMGNASQFRFPLEPVEPQNSSMNAMGHVT